MSENILVSVIIPFYDNKEWLKEAVKSVLNQEYLEKEILVVNDGSDEDIDEIIRLDASIRVISKKNGGPASARNKGMREALGKYIAFLDSDDVWLENKLENQVNFMEKNSSNWSQHSYFYYYEKDQSRKLLDTQIFCGDVLRQTFISFKVQTSCVMIKREILFDENGHLKIFFPENARFGQDILFYQSLAQKFKLDYVENTYSLFRIRQNNAGFRASVQLSSRAMVWHRIRNDASIKGILPLKTKLAFEICDKANKIADHVSRNENISKILYALPYVLFRLSK